MRTATRLLALLLLPWLPFPAHAGSGDSPSSPFAAGKLVVVLGSSTAAGWGPAHPESAWVNRFRTAAQAVDAEREVTNLAVPGYTTYHLMPDGWVPPAGRPTPDTAHNITEAIDLGADAILINLPSNDAVQGFSVAEQLANYDVMLGVATAAGVPVWISTTQPRNTTSTVRGNLMAMHDSTFARWGDKAVDFWTTIANPDGTINPIYDSGDGTHLNDAAHGILFQRMDAKNVWAEIAVPVAEPVAGPLDLRLRAASPNPFRERTTLDYSLARATRVVLDLHDVTGRRVATLLEGDAPTGVHRLDVDGSDLPSGVYFCRRRAGAEQATVRLVRVR